MREHPLSLNRYLAEIGDAGRPLVASKLANLSALSPQELSVVVDAWAGIEVERRREIIGNLVQLAEDNPNLDFDDVFAACLDDNDETVKIRAIDGLWECESRGLIGVFITLLMKDAREPVRAAAATALGKFAMLAELGKSRDDDSAKVENALFAIIDDPGEQSEVTRRALEAIAPLSLPEVKAVIEQAYNSDDAKLRASAIYAMGRNCDPAWLPTLLRELASADAEMRYEAAAACGELGEEDAVPHLGRLVQDIDSEVCLSAITALGEIGGSEAESILRECLGHPDEHICQAAEQALEELSFDQDPMSFGIT